MSCALGPGQHGLHLSSHPESLRGQAAGSPVPQRPSWVSPSTSHAASPSNPVLAPAALPHRCHAAALPMPSSCLSCMPGQPPPSLSQPNRLDDSSEMITFFPCEITCLKWQCWAVIRLLAITLPCRRAASSRAVCLLGGTSARELCHQAQAARDLFSGPAAAGMLSQPQWQSSLPALGTATPWS